VPLGLTFQWPRVAVPDLCTGIGGWLVCLFQGGVIAFVFIPVVFIALLLTLWLLLETGFFHTISSLAIFALGVSGCAFVVVALLLFCGVIGVTGWDLWACQEHCRASHVIEWGAVE